MNEISEKNAPNDPSLRNAYPDADDEINLIDLIYPIYKRRRFLIFFCFIVVVLTGIITLKMSKTYQATTVILPETTEGAGAGELKAAFLEQFGVAGLSGGSTAPSEVFEAVLKSKELAKQVFKRYDYASVMGIPQGRIETAAKSFGETLDVKKERMEPTLSLSIQSSDPYLAADLANTYVIELDKYNRVDMVTSARRLRKYIEKRLEAANRELEQAQEDLRNFQEKHKAISISKQAEATLEVLGEMEARRVELEIQLAAKKKFYRGTHIEIEQLKAQIAALQKNIDRLTYSEKPKIGIEREKGRVEFYIPLTQIPALNFDESRLLLKVKAKTGVVTMLTTQIEQAKLDEAKDLPTINVLDWAAPPDRPIKPKLKLNIILGFVVALFLGIFLIFLLEYTSRLNQDPESSPKWREIKKGLRNPIHFFFKKTKD